MTQKKLAPNICEACGLLVKRSDRQIFIRSSLRHWDCAEKWVNYRSLRHTEALIRDGLPTYEKRIAEAGGLPPKGPVVERSAPAGKSPWTYHYGLVRGNK